MKTLAITCRGCGYDFDHHRPLGAAGRNPEFCPPCRGDHQAVKQLRDQAAGTTQNRTNHIDGHIGREEIAAAIRRLALATGRADTHAALIELRDLASTWATRLAETHEEQAA